MKVRAVFVALCLVSLNLLATSGSANAATCVPDWPESIWDPTSLQSYGPGTIFGPGALPISSGTVYEVDAPRLSADFLSKIRAAGKDIAVSQSISIKNGVGDPEAKAGLISSSDAQVDAGVLDEEARGDFPGYYGFKSYSGQYSGSDYNPGEFSYFPGIGFQTTLTVAQPGCTPRVFISPEVDNPNYTPPSWDSPEVQKWAASQTTNFQTLNDLNNWIHGFTNLTFTGPYFASDFLGKNRPHLSIPISVVFDERSCTSLPYTKKYDFHFVLSGPTQDCSMPIYVFGPGLMAQASSVNISLPSSWDAPGTGASPSPLISPQPTAGKASPPNSRPKTTSWLCIKGKTSIKFVGPTKVCPQGYKVR